MSTTFFLGDEQVKFGPYNIEQLREMIESQELRPTDWVQPEGAGHWQPAESVAELAEAFRVVTGITPSSPGMAGPVPTPSDAITSAYQRSERPFDDDEVDTLDISNREIDYKMIKSFRQQIHALGGVWIFIGALALAAGLMVMAGMDKDLAPNHLNPIFALIITGLALVWIVLGVLTCLKQIPAVYVGLVLSYLSLLGQILNGPNLCGLILILIVIFQAHRVLGWAKKMRAAGVPLTVKP